MSAEFQAALAAFHISVQRAVLEFDPRGLVGPDERKFLVHFLEILTQVSRLISEKLNAAEGTAFIEKHAWVLKAPWSASWRASRSG